MTTPNRREFLKTSTETACATAAVTGLAGAGLNTAASLQPEKPAGANDKIRIGFIGPGGRGFGAHVKRLTKLQVEGEPIELVAVCDVYNKHAERAAKHIKKETGKAPNIYEDYLEMVEKEDLDRR